MGSKMRDSGYGYDYLAAAGRYSGAVVAREGYAVQRVELTTPVVHEVAFELILDYLRARELPGTAVCAVELRSPKQFTESGFAAYNDRYRVALEQLGFDLGRGNPVARSNLVPVLDPPDDVAVHAFSFVSPEPERGSEALAPLDRTFIVSGSAEVPDDKSNYADHIVARGDLSPSGMTRKVHWVVAEMGRRLTAIGAHWGQVSGVQVYTGRDVGAYLAAEAYPVIRRPLSLHLCQPPIVELEYEMDCRRVATELVLDPAVS